MHDDTVLAERVASCMHEGMVLVERVGSCMHEVLAKSPRWLPRVRGLTGLLFATLPGAVWVRWLNWDIRAFMLVRGWY